MGHVEVIPSDEPRGELSPAARAMLRSAFRRLGVPRPDLDLPSEEGLRRAEHARWAADGMEDPGIMGPPCS